ncbi:hypothetical protein, partial [Mesohalobacter salilacus]|uniref:hypothetical protein n=1 Tax=Mesohalobacter salilacus TaxID=2491711 RepID=UPI00403EAD67
LRSCHPDKEKPVIFFDYWLFLFVNVQSSALINESNKKDVSTDRCWLFFSIKPHIQDHDSSPANPTKKSLASLRRVFL